MDEVLLFKGRSRRAAPFAPSSNVGVSRFTHIMVALYSIWYILPASLYVEGGRLCYFGEKSA